MIFSRSFRSGQTCLPGCKLSQVCENQICVSTGSFSLTLTWSTPGDGDLVVTTPNDNTIYYANTGPDSTTDFGQFERDDLVGTGPENAFWNISVTPPTGTYHICFRQFGLTATIANPITATIQVRERFSPIQIISKTFTSRSVSQPSLCRPDLNTFVTSVDYP